jgi:hypothetical protein
MLFVFARFPPLVVYCVKLKHTKGRRTFIKRVPSSILSSQTYYLQTDPVHYAPKAEVVQS